jgi:hypothetical protein
VAAGPTTPTVSAVSPSSGPAAGGTVVTVTGAGFASGATVDFGASAATGVTVTSATSLTATSPAGTGTVDVTVTTAGGTSATTTADQFSYLGSSAPVVSAVGGLADVQGNGANSLSVSPKSQGDALVLSVKVSSATATVTSVTGGGATAWARLVSFQDNASRDLELWLGTVGTAGASTVAVGFSSSVGSDNVELTAQEFTAGLGASTSWAKDAAAGQNNASSTTIASPPLTPTGTGELYFGYSRSPGTVLVGTTPGFTYDPTADGNMVLFDPSVSAAVAPTSTQSPANTSSAVGALIKASPAGTPAPAVTSISPSSGPATGGTVVTVTGANFASGATVDFGASAATGVTVASATSLTATSPAGTGTVDVTVTTAGGTSTTSAADRFSYVGSSAPVVSAVGGLADTSYSSGGNTLTVDPQGIGDVLVVFVDSHAGFALTSLSGGNAEWTKAVQFISARGHDIEMWFGTVTAVGPSRITFTWPSPGISGYWTEYTSQEFTAGLGASTVWAVDDGQAGSLNGPLSTNVPYPTLTSSEPGDLYYGYAGIPNAPSVGGTPGFTYGITTGQNIVCYDTDVSGTVSPSASQYPAGLSEMVAALLTAS